MANSLLLLLFFVKVTAQECQKYTHERPDLEARETRANTRPHVAYWNRFRPGRMKVGR